jgi:hypothetical protein
MSKGIETKLLHLDIGFALAFSMLFAAYVATGAQTMISPTIDASQYSASQLHQMVKERGSLILQTAPGIFDRNVANRSHCGLGQETQTAFVSTADSKDGFVGYRCVIDSDEG